MNGVTQPFFGEPWPSGICDDGHRVPTPTDDRCFLCDEPIEIDHQGSFIYAQSGPAPVHRECQLREVLGGIGHHIDHAYWCGQHHDPDGGLSYRQSALAVWELLQHGRLL